MEQESGQVRAAVTTAAASDAPDARGQAGAWVAGSDAPEKTAVRVGFMPLTDCASVVMASVLGLDRKHGVQIIPTREASWAGVRDKLVAGELDFAQALYGLVYGVHLGLGGPRKDMAVLMTLNQNGQGLTLSRSLAEQGAVDAGSLARLIAREPRRFSFAHTFPTGTHAMWLYYWLASAGINPISQARVLTVPPPQMVAHLCNRQVDGFSVGEPWNHLAILKGAGVSVATSQQVWKDHPEKVLGATSDFVEQHPHTTRAVVMALLEASRWIDASPANRIQAAQALADQAFVGTRVDAILPRWLGRCQDGRGRSWNEADPLQFFQGGAVNFPYLSDGMWFLTQFRRWGLLPAHPGGASQPASATPAEHPDYLGLARQINRTELYREAATALGVDVPRTSLRSSRLIDGLVWDGSDPARYADQFEVHAPAPERLAA